MTGRCLPGPSTGGWGPRTSIRRAAAPCSSAPAGRIPTGRGAWRLQSIGSRRATSHLMVVSYCSFLNFQKYKELYKKGLNDLCNHDGVVTHLQPDILECEAKGALGSISMNKASGGDGIPAELFKILKDDAVKVLHSACQQIWKRQQWPQDRKKVSFHSNPKEGECQRTFTLPHNSTHFTC